MSSRVRTVWIKDGVTLIHNGNLFNRVATFIYDLQGVVSVERMQKVHEQRNQGFISHREALRLAVEIAQAASTRPQYLVVFREQRRCSWRRSKLKKIYDAIGKKPKKGPTRLPRNRFLELPERAQEVPVAQEDPRIVWGQANAPGHVHGGQPLRPNVPVRGLERDLEQARRDVDFVGDEFGDENG